MEAIVPVVSSKNLVPAQIQRVCGLEGVRTSVKLPQIKGSIEGRVARARRVVGSRVQEL